MKFGENLYNLRKAAKMSQEKLAEKMEVTRQSVSKWENGESYPEMEKIMKLCDVFHCELGYLLGEPDYSEGTKIETAITQTTGLNIDALNNIKKITGTEKSCLSFGYESESYRSILNSLFSSFEFISFVECLHDLDTAVTYSKNILNEVEKKIGKERLNEAFELYNSSTYYEHDPNAPELEPQLCKAMGMIDSAIDKQYNLSYTIKIARYELHEAFESLIESLYPRKE